MNQEINQGQNGQKDSGRPDERAKITVRPARPADAAGIQAIMAYFIQETTCSWRYKAMNLPETQAWLAKHLEHPAHRAWVALDGQQVIAYGCLSDFRAPEGYRVCAEDTLYVLPAYSGQGIGSRLMEQLIRQAASGGLQTLVAAIDSSNEGSIRFHERHGFVRCGLLRRVGYKHERWLDLQFMTCDLEQAKPSGPAQDENPQEEAERG